MFLALYIRQPKEFLTQTSQLLSPSRCLNLCLEQSRLIPLEPSLQFGYQSGSATVVKQGQSSIVDFESVGNSAAGSRTYSWIMLRFV